MLSSEIMLQFLQVEEKAVESKNEEEPTVSIKPFVKDWVLKHSKENTPTKSSGVCNEHVVSSST